MPADTAVLRDVDLRLTALDEARRLRPMVAGTLAQLEQAKQGVSAASGGSAREQQFLREAADASLRLAGQQERLAKVEAELRRTAYLLTFLSE